MIQSNQARPQKILRALGVTLAAITGFLLLALIATSTTTMTVYSKDLLQDYVAASALVDGVNPYLTTAELSARYTPIAPGPSLYPTPHTPTAILLFVPFTYVDYVTSLRLWLVIEVACLVAALYLLLGDAGARPTIRLVAAGSAALVLWYPVFEDIGVGQLMLPVLLCLIAMRRAVASKQTIAAGGLLGLALLIKPVPWPLLLLLAWRRQWRALGSAIVTVGAGYALAILVMGPGRVVDYVTRVLPLVSTGFHALSRNLSLWSLGWRIFSGTRVLAFGWIYPGTVEAGPIIGLPSLAPVAAILIPALALAGCVALAYRQSDFGRAYGIMICASLLASPTFWNCYLVLLGLPLSTLVSWRRRQPRPRATFPWIGICLVPTLVPYFALAALVGVLSGAALNQANPVVNPWLALQTMLPTVGVAGLALISGRLGRMPNNIE